VHRTRWKEEDRKEGNWKRVRSDLAFVKVNTWPFADQEVIVLNVLHKLVLSKCACQNYCQTSEYQSSVYLFLCVRVFITSGFIQA